MKYKVIIVCFLPLLIHISLPENSDRHMRILDFTSSVDIASTNIISTLPVPDDQVPPLKWGNILAEDGKLRMFGGQPELFGMLQDNGTTYASGYRRPTHVNQLFTYDIQRRDWKVTSLGLGSKPPCCSNIAYDEEKKVGWIYGGVSHDSGHWIINDVEYIPGGLDRELLDSLIRYDIPQSKGAYVELPLNPIGHSYWGSSTFIAGVGKEGVLILFGGANSDQSMVRYFPLPANRA